MPTATAIQPLMLLVVVIDFGLALVKVSVGIVRVRVHVVGVGWRRGASIAPRAARRRCGRLPGCTRRAPTLTATTATLVAARRPRTTRYLVVVLWLS